MEEEQKLTKKQRRVLAKEEKRKKRESKERSRKIKNGIIALLVIIGLSLGGYKLWQWINTPIGGEGGESVAQDYFEVNESDWINGNPEAPLTLIEYGDFQCPACAAYALSTKKLAEELSEDIRFIYRHFPLVSIHKNAIPSAKAAEAAGEQGKFWEMHDILYEKQSEWEEERNPKNKFVSYALEIGLDEEKFKQDLEDKSLEEKINNDLFSGNRLKVDSTPTFFLNGERIRPPGDYEGFRSIIEEQLAS